MSKEEIARIDAWGEQRDLSRSDAIRAMITQVLDGERRGKHR